MGERFWLSGGDRVCLISRDPACDERQERDHKLLLTTANSVNRGFVECEIFSFWNSNHAQEIAAGL
jgi:hypothetical protein